MSTIESYASHPFKDCYEQRLATAFGIGPHPAPRETWRRFPEFEVHVDEHDPVGPARGTAILVHGAGGNGRLLAPFAAPLVQQGFCTLAPDLPGYGLTRGPSGRATYADWIELVRELAEQAADRGPVVLFGLSVGGMTALRAAQSTDVVAGVVATTLIDVTKPSTFDASARTPLLGRLARLSFRFMPRVVDPIAVPLHWVTPLKALTTDSGLAELLVRDPLLGGRRVPTALFRALHTYQSPRTDYALACPLLLVHPGNDEWTPVRASMPVFEAVPSPKQLITLSNGAHAPLERPAYDELCAHVTRFVQTCLRAA